MIPRYSRPEMVANWSAETPFCHLVRDRSPCDLQAGRARRRPQGERRQDLGGDERPQGQRGDYGFDVARIDEIERTTKHDVIAFLTHLSEIDGPDARFVHQGMTSSDILDTTLSVQLQRAADILLADNRRAAGRPQAPRLRAQGHHHHRAQPRHPCRADDIRGEARRSLCRILAQPARLVAARYEISTRGISGAIGTFANIDPAVEEYVAEKLGLEIEPVSTQVIPRTGTPCSSPRWASFASSIERVAVEIPSPAAHRSAGGRRVLLARPEGLVGHVPHKRHPVLTENLTGLARLVRGMVTPALENVALWHERDISHSSSSA